LNASAPTQTTAPRTPKPEAGLRLIIFYKLVKGIFSLGCSVALWGLILAGEADQVSDVAVHLRHHLTAAWALELVDAFVSAADKHHLEVVAAALALDGSFVLFEWYALRGGKSWGSWLVVLATASLLPFEAIAIAHHVRAGRILIFVVNLAIVGYLARRSLRKHGSPWARDEAAAVPGPPPAESGVKD
jgi:uncharacterized membrane protein (DUF2068 family)